MNECLIFGCLVNAVILSPSNMTELIEVHVLAQGHLKRPNANLVYGNTLPGAEVNNVILDIYTKQQALCCPQQQPVLEAFILH